MVSMMRWIAEPARAETPRACLFGSPSAALCRCRDAASPAPFTAAHAAACWHLTEQSRMQAHGYSKPVGLDHGGVFSHVWSMVTFNWIAPLLSLGARGGIEEQSASPFVPEADDAAVLARQFERQYKECQVGATRNTCSRV